MLLFVSRFYGPVNPLGSCRGWSVYLTKLILGRLSPKQLTSIVHILSSETDNCPSWISRGENDTIYRVLINSRFGVSYSNFSFLTPTFWKVSIEKCGKTPNFFWMTAFYANFQNPSENPDIRYAFIKKKSEHISHKHYWICPQEVLCSYSLKVCPFQEDI